MTGLEPKNVCGTATASEFRPVQTVLTPELHLASARLLAAETGPPVSTEIIVPGVDTYYSPADVVMMLLEDIDIMREELADEHNYRDVELAIEAIDMKIAELKNLGVGACRKSRTIYSTPDETKYNTQGSEAVREKADTHYFEARPEQKRTPRALKSRVLKPSISISIRIAKGTVSIIFTRIRKKSLGRKQKSPRNRWRITWPRSA
jgi:hypothetical protein